MVHVAKNLRFVFIDERGMQLREYLHVIQAMHIVHARDEIGQLSEVWVQALPSS